MSVPSDLKLVAYLYACPSLLHTLFYHKIQLHGVDRLHDKLPSQTQCVSATNKPFIFYLNTTQCLWASTSHQRSFPNTEQWVWCVNIETGSTRTQTIPDGRDERTVIFSDPDPVLNF